MFINFLKALFQELESGQESTDTAPRHFLSPSQQPKKAMSTELSGFPRLVPAIVTKVNIGDVNPLGTIHNGSTLTHYVRLTPSNVPNRNYSYH